MNLLHALLLALRNVRMHAFRSFLTVLGIVFGVCAVITTVSIIEGVSQKILEEVRAFGLENILVRSVRPTVLDKRNEKAETPWLLEYGLRREDLDILQRRVPTIRSVLAFREVRQEVWVDDRRADVQVSGTGARYPEVMRHGLSAGRFFHESENREAARVCVLGPKAREQLFGSREAIGRDVKIRSLYFRVVGILESLEVEGGDFRMENRDRMIFLPLETAERLLGLQTGNEKTPEVDLAVVQVAGEENVSITASVIETFLRDRHEQKDFEMVVPVELLAKMREIQWTAAIVAGAIAAISLLVGGIGIMNIMLANLAERRPEIGLRRAVGATRHDIVVLFLAESVILAMIGGALGIGLGVAGAFAVTTFAGHGVFRTVITPGSVLLGVVVSVAVGVISGSFPAFRASRLDPVVALREG